LPALVLKHQQLHLELLQLLDLLSSNHSKQHSVVLRLLVVHPHLGLKHSHRVCLDRQPSGRAVRRLSASSSNQILPLVVALFLVEVRLSDLQ
jgi:hypothetical protein